MRSSNKPEPEAMVTEQPVSGFWCESGMCNWTNSPVEMPWTYTYTVYALVPNSIGGFTMSTASPPATTTSIVGPTGLRYAVTLTGAPGKVNVAITWDAIAGATQYSMTGLATLGQSVVVVSTNSYTVTNVTAGGTYRICVSPIFGNIADPTRTTCIDVVLK
jgi:hypothetical protein